VRVAVTGAGGFVGSALVAALLEPPGSQDQPELTQLVAVDAVLSSHADPRVVRAEGDLADPAFRESLFSAPYDVVFHLAAVPGGAAARNPGLGWRVNVEATLAILDSLAAQTAPARLVFSSSIGVFGVPLPADRVDDETLPLPTMSYGAHKLIGETLVADYARRGLVDGIALRLPGILARPRVKGGHLSAYMSDILHAMAAGEDFLCPVSRDATSWFMSRTRCIDNLLHAATLPRDAELPRRAFNLPALRLSMAELIAGAETHFGQAAGRRVRFDPNAALEAQFGAYPPLATPVADALGFCHDGDAPALVARALGLNPSTQTRGAA
jgi:nucleoside-diphosphate-sugar epimerase